MPCLLFYINNNFYNTFYEDFVFLFKCTHLTKKCSAISAVFCLEAIWEEMGRCGSNLLCWWRCLTCSCPSIMENDSQEKILRQKLFTRKMFLYAYRVAIFIPMLRKYWLLQVTIASHFCNHCTDLQSLYRLLVKWFVPANPNSHARPLNGLKIYQQKQLLRRF